MATEQKGFVVYGDIKETIDAMTDEQVGAFFRGMVEYFLTGEEPAYTDGLRFAWIPIRQQMDRDAEKYEKRCEKNRENIQKRYERIRTNTNVYDGIRTSTKSTNTNTNTDTNTRTDTDTESVPDAGLLSFDLIEYLNEKTGSDYRADRANAERIQALLDAGYSPEQIRSVIDKKCAEWLGDEKMRPYLRPSTLWGDKFGEYVSAPESISQERERSEAKKKGDLEAELDRKRRKLADLKVSLSVADKTERRQLREQIALLEDSIGIIEGRLRCWPA